MVLFQLLSVSAAGSRGVLARGCWELAINVEKCAGGGLSAAWFLDVIVERGVGAEPHRTTKRLHKFENRLPHGWLDSNGP